MWYNGDEYVLENFINQRYRLYGELDGVRGSMALALRALSSLEDEDAGAYDTDDRYGSGVGAALMVRVQTDADLLSATLYNESLERMVVYMRKREQMILKDIRYISAIIRELLSGY
ncbi:unnamed protein product [Phytomonas sp. Hart1]|nr:unnamed protein product [Phytomonas sp. Hart1]|eukprot:CCW72200.1 unnamed protein product [Phytomonas sp. isolate Hart1]